MQKTTKNKPNEASHQHHQGFAVIIAEASQSLSVARYSWNEQRGHLPNNKGFTGLWRGRRENPLHLLNQNQKSRTMKDGQTIGQWLNWDFETNGSLEVLDKNGNLIYFENEGGWRKYKYDSQGNIIYYEDSDGDIVDRRTPEVIEHNGRKYQLIP
jgi:YD repeat-containing protein